MKSRILFTLCLFSLSVALSAGGFALSGVGARAISMGGAMRGLADDYTAMYWNPAGLAWMQNNQASLCLATVTPTMNYTPTVGWLGIVDDDQVDAEKKTWMFPNLYYVPAARSRLNWGVGVYVPYGLGAKWDIWQPSDTILVDVNNDGVADMAPPVTWSEGVKQYEFESSIGIVDAHPSVSYKITDKLSAGLGVSVYYGMIGITKLIPTEGVANTGLPKILEMDGTGFGVGANLGLMWKALPNFQVGLSGKLPSSVKLEGEATVTAYINSFYASIDGNTANNDPYSRSSKPDVEATVNLPAEAGIGLAWFPQPQWVVTGDFAWTGWSCLDEIEIKFDGLTPDLTWLGHPAEEMEDSALNTQWEDALRFSLGTEYSFYHVGALDLLALRGGFYYDESPIPSKSLDPTWPDVGTKTSANIGLGLGKGNWQLDTGFEYIAFENHTVDEQTADNMTGEYDTSIIAVNVGLLYKF